MRGHNYDPVTERCEFCDMRWHKAEKVDCPAATWNLGPDLGVSTDIPMSGARKEDHIGFADEWRQCPRCKERFPGRKYWHHTCRSTT